LNTSQDLSDALREQVLKAATAVEPLALQGGNSKAFYGRRSSGRPLALAGHRGIVGYEPSELVISARAGTPLEEIETTLAAQGQMLPFEPPHFGPGGTIGGAIACGLGGPRRPWGGAPRDLLLGVKLLDGRGQILEFGGRVMKNVAGYDISRLMVGAMGTLGILLEVSIKVLPAPPEEHTLQFESHEQGNRTLTSKLLRKGLPVTASYAHHGVLRVRLACGEERLRQIRQRYGGEVYADAEGFWRRLRDQHLAFFADRTPLWRLSLPQAAPLELPGPLLSEWGGALRWLKSAEPAAQIRAALAKQGGHAILFRNGDPEGEIFHPLQVRVARLHQAIKKAFDPQGIFNPGRLYEAL